MRKLLKELWAEFIQFLAAVGNARPDVRKQVPNALGPAIMTGATIVLTATIGAITMAYAIATAFAGTAYGVPAGILAGAVWASFILCIDRALVAAIDKSGSKWTQLGSALVRLPFAIAVGVVISKPVLLRVVSPVLDHELRTVRNAEIAAERAGNASMVNLAQASATADSTARAFEQQSAILGGTPSGYEVDAARASINSAEAVTRREMPRLLDERARTNELLAIIGAVPRSASDSTDAARLIARASETERRIDALNGNTARARTALENANDAWRKRETTKLVRAESLATVASVLADSTRGLVRVMNASSDSALTTLLRENLVNRYTTLRSIEANPKHPAARSLTVFEFALDLLFIILECTPMGIKLLSRRTSLDDAIAAAEFVDTERVNVEANVAQARAQRVGGTKMRAEEIAQDILEADLINRLRRPGLSRKDIDDILAEIQKLAA